MRALLQRVSRASVKVDGTTIASIGDGLVILVGVGHGDDEATAAAMARRITELRIFRDGEGRANRSIIDTGGSALVVSQFTLYADTARGRRPGFTDAADPAVAERLYLAVAAGLRTAGVVDVQTGSFGAEMAVELVNDGPFTIWLDTAGERRSSATVMSRVRPGDYSGRRKVRRAQEPPRPLEAPSTERPRGR